MKNILGHLRRADQDFEMISAGDKIAVGLSGGKDSLTLVSALKQYQKFNLKPFEIIAITIDCTNGKADFGAVKRFCDEHDTPYFVEPSNIFEVIFDIRKEKSPCSLCSKMRRGALIAAAKRLGCNKIALGHHGDDLVETFLLCMTHEGRISTFMPKSYLDRTDITLIRPFVYAREDEIIAVSRDFPILKNCCAVNGKTRREYMKDLVKRLNADIPDARGRMIDAVMDYVRVAPPLR